MDTVAAVNIPEKITNIPIITAIFLLKAFLTYPNSDAFVLSIDDNSA